MTEIEEPREELAYEPEQTDVPPEEEEFVADDNDETEDTEEASPAEEDEEVPEKFRGKSRREIAQAYAELEQKHGIVTDALKKDAVVPPSQVALPPGIVPGSEEAELYPVANPIFIELKKKKVRELEALGIDCTGEDGSKVLPPAIHENVADEAWEKAREKAKSDKVVKQYQNVITNQVFGADVDKFDAEHTVVDVNDYSKGNLAMVLASNFTPEQWNGMTAKQRTRTMRAVILGVGGDTEPKTKPQGRQTVEDVPRNSTTLPKSTAVSGNYQWVKRDVMSRYPDLKGKYLEEQIQDTLKDRGLR
jgi:hypothetical protein